MVNVVAVGVTDTEGIKSSITDDSKEEHGLKAQMLFIINKSRAL